MSISQFKINLACQHLNRGEVIAYPTEAVYGFGCDPLNKQAVLALLDLKQRPIDKGLILIAAEIAQLEPYIRLNATILERITPTWPGPVTWVIPAQDWVPHWLTGKHTSLAVRVTNHPVARKLCQRFNGALVSTSANPSNKPAVKQAQKLIRYFPKQAFYLLSGSVGNLGKETAIYDAISGKQFR
ncbi:MAG: Sua5/YciO/YrdC/YwlC family protein [Methylococcaceae bacterium]